MSWRIWAEFIILILLVGIGFFTLDEYARGFYRVLSNTVSGVFLAALITPLLLVIFYALFRPDISDYSLLKRGNCVVGTVVSQTRVRSGKGSRSEISYSFSVGPGKPMTGRGTDWTHDYLKDMPVLVFFDPEAISRNVAYCCTGWKVRLQDGTFLKP